MNRSDLTTDTRRRGRSLALLAVTQFVLVLDASIVGVAMPSIGADLSFAPEDLSWVANAYILAFGGLLLLGGRAADLLGRRRMFVVGTAVFTAASLAGALSVNAWMLVGARAAQGVGAAIVAPAALSLLMTIFPPGPDRNKAMGVFGAVAGAGGAAGSILGGVLTEWLGWESTLYVNVPIGVAVIVLAYRLLPEASDPTARGFDVAGAVTVTAGLTLLVYTLVNANHAGWLSARTIGLGAVALALLALFGVVETRSAHPLVPVRIFRSKTLRGANIMSALTNMAMLPLFFYMTFYMQQVLGYGPIAAGLRQLPLALAIGATAASAAGVIARFGVRTTMAAGLFVTAVGLAWFSRMSADGSYLVDVLGPSVVIGVGAGLAFVTTTVAATSDARPEQAGLASGLFATSQQFGGALALAVVVSVATARTTDAFGAGEGAAVALSAGYRIGMVLAAAAAVVAGVLALLVVPSRVAAPGAEPSTTGGGPAVAPAAEPAVAGSV